MKPGLGGRVGFGKRPAVVAVDFSRAFTTTDSPLGADFSIEMDVTNAVVAAGRDIDMLAAYSVVQFSQNLRDAGPWFDKIPSSQITAGGTPWVELDERIAYDADRDIIVPKKYPSVFFGTDLATILINRGVDTLIVTGITTSGCVRATVVDAVSYGFRTIVVRDAVADRAELPHLANLFDMEMKYADVVSSDEVVEYLQSLRAKVGV